MGLRWPGAARQLKPIRIGSLCHEREELEAVHAIERRRPEAAITSRGDVAPMPGSFQVVWLSRASTILY